MSRECIIGFGRVQGLHSCDTSMYVPDPCIEIAPASHLPLLRYTKSIGGNLHTSQSCHFPGIVEHSLEQAYGTCTGLNIRAYSFDVIQLERTYCNEQNVSNEICLSLMERMAFSSQSFPRLSMALLRLSVINHGPQFYLHYREVWYKSIGTMSKAGTEKCRC